MNATTEPASTDSAKGVDSWTVWVDDVLQEPIPPTPNGPVAKVKEPAEGRLPGPTQYETMYRKRGTIKSANHRAKQARKLNRPNR